MPISSPQMKPEKRACLALHQVIHFNLELENNCKDGGKQMSVICENAVSLMIEEMVNT